MASWVIRQNTDGTCDVFRDRRLCVYDRDGVTEALDRIRHDLRWSPADMVILEEPDGYRSLLRVR